jgi:hypothetical protein
MKVFQNPLAKDLVEGSPGMLNQVCWHACWRKMAQGLTQDLAQGAIAPSFPLVDIFAFLPSSSFLLRFVSSSVCCYF